MLLVIDVGNTNIVYGLFDGAKLVHQFRVESSRGRTADEYAVVLRQLLEMTDIEPGAVDASIVASVVPALTEPMVDLVRRAFGHDPLVVGPGLRSGMPILYENPREVGADRIVDVVAALQLYGPPPLIIVDFGTATVFDAVSAEGDYLGGAIAPGIGISSEALFERAAKLYRVELERPKTAIGKNTVGAIQSGTLFGYVGLIEGMVARFKKELGGEARVVATGGWATLLAKETQVFDAVDVNLTLTGLRLIHEAHQRAGRD
jgi:type III pantothenate kinase